MAWSILKTNTVAKVAFVVFVIGVVTACSSAKAMMGSSGSWRYKMTVTVDTPEGLKIGSAVREVSAMGGGIKLSPHAVAQVEVKGEAVVVDLGQRGVVFALLRGSTRGSDYADAVVYKALPVPDNVAPLTPAGIKYYSSIETTPPVDLTQDNLPVFVRFRDPADPKTVEAVKPDGFAEAFGEGVKLKSVTIEMTREPVTRGVVESYLSWMEVRAKLPGAIGGDPETPFQDPTKTWLTPGDFRTRK